MRYTHTRNTYRHITHTDTTTPIIGFVNGRCVTPSSRALGRHEVVPDENHLSRRNANLFRAFPRIGRVWVWFTGFGLTELVRKEPENVPRGSPQGVGNNSLVYYVSIEGLLPLSHK